MTLSLQQIADRNAWFSKWFYIHERDLLQCARDYSEWRLKAHDLGFTDERIDRPWEHKDEGRQIRYAENPNWFRQLTIEEIYGSIEIT